MMKIFSIFLERVGVYKMSDKAKTPERSTQLAAGYDVFSSENVVIEVGERKKISTKIQIDIPQGYVGKIESRSGLSFHHGIVVISSIIDADYCGEIFVCVTNLGNEAYEIKLNDRVAQIIFFKVYAKKLKKMMVFEKNSARGVGGFGSTGV